MSEDNSPKQCIDTASSVLPCAEVHSSVIASGPAELPTTSDEHTVFAEPLDMSMFDAHVVDVDVIDVEPKTVEHSCDEMADDEAKETEPVVVGPAETAPAETAPAETADVKPSNGKQIPQQPGELGFLDLPLSKEVQKAVTQAGYEKPTDVQGQIIPHMLDGRDLLAQSQTGTGKTAAFAMPILSKIDTKKRKPQVLVLAPTRELAIQVAKSFSTYGSCVQGFSVAAIYGGQSYEPQLKQLRRGVHVVVGTPGRVIDHIRRGTLDISEIDCLVLDEADEMLNMGFLEDVQFVLEKSPEKRQIALFSATLPEPIRNIAQRYLTEPMRITIKTKTMTADSIRQRALFVPGREKLDALIRLLEVEETDGVIVFTKTKASTTLVAEQLIREGLLAVALNGDMTQAARERTISQLKAGRLNILVATDVAARGLDVTRVSHVFNFDLPHDTEGYIHRVGRTGRAGRNGEAIIFLTNSQRHHLRSIERATKQPIEIIQAPSAEAINAIRIKRFLDGITKAADIQEAAMFQELITRYAEETGKPMEVIAAALAHIGQRGVPFLMQDRPKRQPSRDQRREGSGRERFESDSGYFERRPPRHGKGDFRRNGPPQHGMSRYRIEVGRDDGVKPGNIVGAVANEAGIDGDAIGPIKIHDDHSTIDLPTGMPPEMLRVLQHTRVAGKPMRMTESTDDADHGSGARHRGSGGKSHRGKKSFNGKTFSKGKKPHGGKYKNRKAKT